MSEDLTLVELIAKSRVMHSFLPEDDKRTKNEYVADELRAAGYRKVGAAPSDTDRAVLQDDLRALAVMLGDLYPNSRYGPLCTEAADALSRSSQPVQVEVTDDMVERAAFVLWEDYESEYEGASAAQFREVARAALSAALGGGDHVE